MWALSGEDSSVGQLWVEIGFTERFREKVSEMKQTAIDTTSQKDAESGPSAQSVPQHIVEIVSDSGEGAQTCGQMFGTISAKMGNGIWTVEIIPAEIEPPHRSQADSVEGPGSLRPDLIFLT